MVQTQIAIQPRKSTAWRSDVARAIRITAILFVLAAWFVVVAIQAAGTLVRSAVIEPSHARR